MNYPGLFPLPIRHDPKASLGAYTLLHKRCFIQSFSWKCLGKLDIGYLFQALHITSHHKIKKKNSEWFSFTEWWVRVYVYDVMYEITFQIR